MSMTGGGNKRVLVAMSGGVDSSVVAAVLVKEGWDVLGATLQLNPCQDRQGGQSCCGVQAVLAARSVADQLGIPHTVMDCRREFEAQVLRPAWDDYTRGHTPSPCVVCNQDIKFGYLLHRANTLGASHVATGHYARVVVNPDGRRHLLRGQDANKDQSYFLFALSGQQLGSVLFPLGGMTKPEVRVLARELGLATAERADSQDACLGSGGEGFAEALRDRFDAPARPGVMVDREGKVLARHDGLHQFTIGQRKGLGLALGARAFVVDIRDEDAAVVISTREQDLWGDRMVVRPIRAPEGEPWPARCAVQIRSRHTAAAASITVREDGWVDVRFDQPQRAITCGQAAVFYAGDRVLGGGWIVRAP